MSGSSKVYAVIMAGGAGTRFWPASRSLRPKQLLPLAGSSDEPLLAATVRRLAPLVTEDRVLVVTGEHLAAATAKALPGVPPSQILKEPAPRNTAPCIAWANATIARLDPEAIVMVLPSDHYITDEAEFRRVLDVALKTAATGRVTTVGIVPTRPETGYGYIEVGGAIDGGANEVARFVEKPDRARAEAFVAGKKHLWNAGMFFFRVADMTKLVAQHLPALAEGVAKIDAAARSGDDAGVVKAVFPTLPSISIDHGVMEKAEGLAVVPGSFGWNDVGSWQSAWELADRDAAGNALPPGAIAIDGKNNLVRTMNGSKKVIALVGVNDLVVVETDDAILVIPRDRAQDVRLVVDALKGGGRGELV
ncbi:MAG: mannose-1-phosphate guanylyltransferase [Deltaproteobacteria bacterium]|nr:mannose-1-phosphate guanylyltransferase [Deltaproteobacteria bacterium]